MLISFSCLGRFSPRSCSSTTAADAETDLAILHVIADIFCQFTEGCDSRRSEWGGHKAVVRPFLVHPDQGPTRNTKSESAVISSHQTYRRSSMLFAVHLVGATICTSLAALNILIGNKSIRTGGLLPVIISCYSGHSISWQDRRTQPMYGNGYRIRGSKWESIIRRQNRSLEAN